MARVRKKAACLSSAPTVPRRYQHPNTTPHIEWWGWIEAVVPSWSSIQTMADIGGAIGLVQIVRSAIDRVLRRYLLRWSPVDPRTEFRGKFEEWKRNRADAKD